ncbi:MAG: DUF4915 domain-containing protein [Acidimicrobiia bacterium]|nr:DUF4915 domain-containing protein [Acidimicrobiia bacterium]
MEILGPPLDPDAPLAVRGSDDLTTILGDLGVAIAVTTYRDGFVVLVGSIDGRLVTRQRHYGHASAIATGPDGLLVAGAGVIHGPAGATPIGTDHDVHALAVDGDGVVVFCSTRRSCLATPDGGGGWTVRWRPDFVTATAPEDRCHLNGFTLDETGVEAATALGVSDEPAGWRDRLDRGVVVGGDGRVVADRLWLPHSPIRLGGDLWIAESGTGSVGVVSDGVYEPVAHLPGFTRGLATVGGHLVVGLSMPWRARHALPVTDRLDRDGAMCGFAVVDVGGRVLASCWVSAPRGEVLDVAAVALDAGT